MHNETPRNPVTGRRRFLGTLSLLGLGVLSVLSSLSPAALAATRAKKVTSTTTQKSAAAARTSTTIKKSATVARKSVGKTVRVRRKSSASTQTPPATDGPSSAFTGSGDETGFDWDLSEKTLSLVAPQTGERLVHVPFWVNGSYQSDAIEEISHLMRDWRTGEMYPVDPALLELLHDLRRTIGTGEPFQVVCGYRSPETNAILRRSSRRVARNSLHMEGKAIDIRLADGKTSEIYRAALALNRGGVGWYPRMGFVHVDTGPVRTWRS
jgi:uncharacterized protein YcbK (DUF882 family)